MNKYTLLLIAMLCISLLSSCTNNDNETSETYEYCVYSSDKFCADGPFTKCQENGRLSNTCPYSSSSSPNGISSSSSKPSSSSSSCIGSSSSIESYVSSSSSKLSSSSSDISSSSSPNDLSSSGVANVGSSCDIKDYRTVKIGSQTWMAENLNCDVVGSKCYNNDSTNCDKYGRLYNWSTAKTVCPSGWHLPSEDEWDKLINYVESNSGCISCAGRLLKADCGWNNYDRESGNGTDDYGFSALPGGINDYKDSKFYYIGTIGFWWSNSEGSEGLNGVSNSASTLYINRGASVLGSTFYKVYMYSVRCVQD